MMKKIIALLMAAVMGLALVACQAAPADKATEEPAAATEPAAEPAAETAAVEETAAPDPDADKYVEDATFRYLYNSEITTMDYLSTSVTDNFKSSANFVDTLIEYDKYGVAQPCLATEWSCSDDGLVWTLKLREGVKWYDCELNEYADVTAKDFVYALQYVLTPANESDNVDTVCSAIKNAREYFDGTVTDFAEVGVKAIDDYTLEYTLKGQVPYFLSMLTYVAFMPVNQQFVEEQGDLFGTSNDTILYNGAYYCTSWEPQAEFIWEKNPNYWDADKIYITTVSGKYNAESDSIAPEMYLRGEIDEATISSEILDSWLAGADTKELVRPNRPTYDAMWWFFNFDPQFDEPYDSENFKLAVNNTNWRMSIVYALDRVKAMMCYDPYSQDNMMKTITPPNFVAEGGVDFTMTGDLKEISEKEWFAPETALEYKTKAIEELTAAGCKLPVVIPYYYRVDQANQDSVAQVVEQQLESVLGTDYIDIVTIAGPATNYISEVRRAGKYGLMEEGWGPDFADPSTYADPWGLGWTYGSRYAETDPSLLTGYTYTQEDYDNLVIDDEAFIGQPQHVYDKMVQEARAETTDLAKRYELFAKAEAWLINNGIAIPFRCFSKGYTASKLTVFDGEYSPFGVCVWRYKGRHMLKDAMSIEDFESQYAAWKTERAEALSNVD